MLPDYLVSPRYYPAAVAKPEDEKPEDEKNSGVAGAAAKNGKQQSNRPQDDASDHGEQIAVSAQNEQQIAQQRQSIQDYEKQILSGRVWAGQSCNSLLEERDRHVRERIFCAAKIETFVNVLCALTQQAMISDQELHQLIADAQRQIASQSEEIWLNLITREKSLPTFYQFEDKYSL